MVATFKKIAFLCTILNMAVIVSIIMLKNNLPPIVPLFYGLPVSESQLAPSIALVIPPTISIIFTSLNLILNKLFKNEFLAQIFIGLAVVTSALSIITVVKIILLVW